MDHSVRLALERSLHEIPSRAWKDFFEHDVAGRGLGVRLQHIRGALREAGSRSTGGTPASLLVDLLGTRVLSDRHFGPWVREQILRNLPVRTWRRLAAIYRESRHSDAEPLHGNANQEGLGSWVMARYWRQGGRWAEAFCELAGLPSALALSSRDRLPEDEDVIPAEALPPLHDFQLEVYDALREMLGRSAGKTALLSLPTGAGKTRVAVESVCDHFAEASGIGKDKRNVVLWISVSSELQLQAWECFRQVWQVPPNKPRGRATVRRNLPLRIVRLWGGRDAETVQFGDEPTVLVAGIDQLASWVHKRPEWFRRFPIHRLACVFVDEAHSLITREHAQVLVALGLRQRRRWRPVRGAAPVIGLSATPWRTRDEETLRLLNFFGRRLVRPRRLGAKPIRALQKRGILSTVRSRRIRFGGSLDIWEGNSAYQERFEQFGEIPADFLDKLGQDSARNGKILARLCTLSKRRKSIVFACSVGHADLLAAALNRAHRRACAASVTAHTPRGERLSVVNRFRHGDLRFIVNVGVLALGFDAPRADVVFVTRPTTSAIRYEQMVGRGLRGPKNGGTRRCLVIDVQDEGLPVDIQSYARVIELWDGRQRRGRRRNG